MQWHNYPPTFVTFALLKYEFKYEESIYKSRFYDDFSTKIGFIPQKKKKNPANRFSS